MSWNIICGTIGMKDKNRVNMTCDTINEKQKLFI